MPQSTAEFRVRLLRRSSWLKRDSNAKSRLIVAMPNQANVYLGTCARISGKSSFNSPSKLQQIVPDRAHSTDLVTQPPHAYARARVYYLSMVGSR